MAPTIEHHGGHSRTINGTVSCVTRKLFTNLYLELRTFQESSDPQPSTNPIICVIIFILYISLVPSSSQPDVQGTYRFIQIQIILLIFTVLKGLIHDLGQCFLTKNYFTWKSYRMLTDSNPKMYKHLERIKRCTEVNSLIKVLICKYCH